MGKIKRNGVIIDGNTYSKIYKVQEASHCLIDEDWKTPFTAISWILFIALTVMLVLIFMPEKEKQRIIKV